MARRQPAAASLALVLLALAGCRDTPRGTRDAIEARLRLSEVEEAELLEGDAARGTARLMSEDFEREPAGWLAATDATAPLAGNDGSLTVERVASDGESVLRLSGSRGVLYRMIEVEPGACLEVRARLRTRGLVASREPFHGATLYVAELDRAGAPETVFADGVDAVIRRRHLFPSAHAPSERPGDEPDAWVELHRRLRTDADTRSLLVSLVLAFEEEVQAGALEVDELELLQQPLRRWWEDRAAEAVADMARGEAPPSGWRARRLVRGLLGAEVRPSVLALPGDALRFEVTVPAGDPCLELGLGPWERALLPGAPRAQRFTVRVAGETLLERDAPAPAERAEARWHDEVVELGPWAGERVVVELALEGELPGLFGAPRLRDRAFVPELPSVLLISIDTLRADHLGCYGAPGDPTPNLDRLAAQGVRFAKVVGQAPYTLPGHATMLTGQFPSVHGVQATTHALSSTRSPLLAQLLARRGYRTQAFTGGGFVNADFGFDKGFDGFANIDPLRHREARFFQSILEQNQSALRRLRRESQLPGHITAELIAEYGPERVERWLTEHADQPFFLFVHTYAVHDYDPPPGYLTCHEGGCTSQRVDYEAHRLGRRTGWKPVPISDADREHLGHLYDATLRFTDELVGRLIAHLDALGLGERTLVAIATDHGEEMFERGFMQHGKTLYEELLDLPMILRGPGLEPAVIEEHAMLVDLVPTILGRLGIARDARMQGRDLLGEPIPERFLLSEIHDDLVHKYALRSPDGWKLIHAPPDEEIYFPAQHEWELFHLEEDPGERTNLAAEREERRAALEAELDRQREALRALAESLGSAGGGALDEGTLQQLRLLGYVE